MYVVQVKCTGMGWVDTKHSGATIEEARQAERALLANDAAWMPCHLPPQNVPRETRIEARP